MNIFIHTECPAGMWGKNCSHTCECENDGVCNQFNGFCTCPKGYTGTKCELECPNGQYGLNCSEMCRCQNNGTCHHISGECRCAAGFTGPLCTETCPDGKHGQECKQECKCQNNGKCDPHTGVCECPPGMTNWTIQTKFWLRFSSIQLRRYRVNRIVSWSFESWKKQKDFGKRIMWNGMDYQRDSWIIWRGWSRSKRTVASTRQKKNG